MSDGTTEQTEGTEGAQRRAGHPVATVTVLVVVLLVAVTAGSFLAWRSRQPGPTRFCAGVGLIGGPAAPTPEGAFSAWLATGSGQPPAVDWHRDSRTSYTNRTYDRPGGHGYRSVQLGRPATAVPGGSTPPGDWSVQGACV